MKDSQTKPFTLDDLKKEVEDWRKKRPETKTFSSFFTDPVDRAGGMRTLAVLCTTLISVPLIELANLLVVRPGLTIFHTTIVVAGTITLRFLARPLLRLGCWAVRKKDKGIGKLIYDNYGKLLHLTIVLLGPSLKWYFRIDPDDIRSAGKFQEWINDTLGVEGIWVESDISRAVRHETWCPFVGHDIPYDPTCKGKYDPTYTGDKSCTKGCPEYCSVLMVGWLKDFLRYINPDFDLEPMKYMLPNGDDYCEMVYIKKQGHMEAEEAEG